MVSSRRVKGSICRQFVAQLLSERTNPRMQGERIDRMHCKVRDQSTLGTPTDSHIAATEQSSYKSSRMQHIERSKYQD